MARRLVCKLVLAFAMSTACIACATLPGFRNPNGPRFVGVDAGAMWTLGQRTAFDVAIDTSLSDASVRPALMFGFSRVLGEVAGHRGVAARMREAQRRGDR